MPLGEGRTKLMRTVWYPQPHRMRKSWAYELDDATIDDTIFPLLMYDEGLGTPSAQETHPENANFLVVDRPNCFVNSRVNKVTCQLRLSLTSKALDDNIPAIACRFMVIKMAFKNDYTAIDELTSIETQDVLEMQTESTDRQGFPLWNGTKMATRFANSGIQDAAVPGLTTNQNLEGVTFSPSAYYDSIFHLTIAGKMKSLQRGLKVITLTHNRPTVTITIHIDSKVKRMNEYSFMGLLVGSQVVDTHDQIPVTADITAATNYVYADLNCRYFEWNEHFDFKKV